jgi:hypothetical protein
MPPDESERRRTVRRIPQPDETLARVRLRTGRELSVINISPTGVLVEGGTRLLPGTHADVHVVTRHGRTLVRARVIRSLVWRLQADSVSYRAALAFETNVDTEADGYALPAESPMNEGDAGNAYPNPEVPGHA